MQSRSEARRIFARSGLSYADITPRMLADLRSRVSAELDRTGILNGQLRLCGGFRTKFANDDGALLTAELRCRSHYFSDRQAISFEPGGFIGLCGWADDTNAVPFISALTGWVIDHAPARAAMDLSRMARAS